MRVSQFVTATAIAAPLAAAAALAARQSANSPSEVDGRVFSLDGKTQYFAGTNAWWLGHLWDDSDVETTFTELVDAQLKIVRVWGFGNSNSNTSTQVYYQLISNDLPGLKTAINYGSNGIARLDSVVSHAEKYGVQLVLPLINNWDDLGGINTYCTVFNCNGTTFYTNEEAQAAYRNYVEFIVNRYKSSPAIFAWELGNEPRCRGCSTDVIYNWASEVSALIKSLDPSHLVTLGDEGWLCNAGDGSYAYSCYEGVDFARNLQIPTLDYGTFHLYPDSWGYNNSWGNTWIREHDALGAAAGKPVIFEEYGAATDRLATEAEWQRTVLEDTSLAADQFWQFGSTAPGTQSLGDIHTITYGTDEFETLVRKHAADMLAKPVT